MCITIFDYFVFRAWRHGLSSEKSQLPIVKISVTDHLMQLFVLVAGNVLSHLSRKKQIHGWRINKNPDFLLPKPK